MKLKLILFIAIFFLSLFLRLYKIADIPNGFNQDESAIGYNAYSILETGKDEYGKSFPLYFKSFGDQKLPAYIYLTAASEKIFGLNEFAARFPSALLGSLTVIMLIFLLQAMGARTWLAFTTGLFLALNPWHLFFSRAAFEDNVALSFAVFGSWMFFVALKSRKVLFFFLSMIGFALSLYSYNVTRLLAPVLLVGIVWFNWKTLKQFSRKILISVIFFFVILLIPFIITFFSSEGVFSAQGALITSTDIQAKSIEMRSYLLHSAPIVGMIFFNKFFYMGWQYIQNLINSLSVNFFFISGSQHGSQGIGNVGNFYLVELPFILLGIITIIKNKIKNLYFFLFWAIVTLLVLSLSKEVPHATRGYFFVIPFVVFSALGFIAIINYIQRTKHKLFRFSIIFFVAALCIYNVVYYFSSYYFRFPILYAKNWRQQDKVLAIYIKENEQKYDKIIFDNKAGFIYTSLLFFNAYPPEQFQNTQKRSQNDSEGFNHVLSFGKYEWKDIDWAKDVSDGRNLIITSADNLPQNIPTLNTFLYPERPVTLSIKEQLFSYPVVEPAYVLIETK